VVEVITWMILIQIL